MYKHKEQQQLKKLTMMIRLLLYGQFIVLSLVVIYLVMRFLRDQTLPQELIYLGFIVMLIIMLLLSGYFIFRDKSVVMDLGEQLEFQHESYENVKQLNSRLRGQRHDFLNHLQVLYTLVELDAYEEAKKYLDDLYGDVGRLSAVLKTKSLPFNALVQAKSNECEKSGIELELLINTPFDQYAWPDWELCRVVANLLDNAIEACAEANESKLKLELNEKITTYELMIVNSYSLEKPIEINRFFEEGYTTKSEKIDHGVGLVIVKKLVEKYDGQIAINIKSGMVCTTLTINKKL